MGDIWPVSMLAENLHHAQRWGNPIEQRTALSALCEYYTNKWKKNTASEHLYSCIVQPEQYVAVADR